MKVCMPVNIGGNHGWADRNHRGTRVMSAICMMSKRGLARVL
jgi:hypothetical protein